MIDAPNPSFRHVELDIDIGADAKDWSAVQSAEKLKPVETELRRIEETINEVVQEMEYLRSREQKLRDTNESTNERVKWFAFGTMGMLVGLGVWQVVYLRAYFSLLSSEIVEIIVGKNPTVFRAHKDLLYATSPSFESRPVLWKRNEAGALQIRMTDRDAKSVGYVLRWIYEWKSNLTTDKSFSMRTLIDIWYAAEYFLLYDLMNIVMDAIKAKCRDSPITVSDFRQAKSAVTANENLEYFFRARLVYGLVSHDNAPTYREVVDELLSSGMEDEIAVLMDEMVHLARWGEIRDPAEKEGCAYHYHHLSQGDCKRDDGRPAKKRRIAYED
ncbi:MAG: hypothetical protein Q9227_005330 [Pyrenula ochraceoflavens]